MESRIGSRALSILIASAVILSASVGIPSVTSFAMAATTKATPKPTVKATKKPVVKKKAAPKKSASKKKVVRKKRGVTVAPSPKPAWPPKGFRENSQVYAKVPTAKELVGILSATKTLATQVKKCSTVACGAVRVASAMGCTWWEITSTVSGPTSDVDSTLRPLGALRTTAVGTKRREIVTILLISTESLKPDVTVSGISVNCYHSPVTGRVPSNSYVANTPTPTPAPSASISPSNSPSPGPTS
ncbi:MAG: hypothetical protein Q8K86_06415 [Candidatus Nanopelagicaceae bacterium]|nr:hypothetical protein [Candidatus Nanopelagicaceae bacterium]